jgi:acyl-CoA thioesterase
MVDRSSEGAAQADPAGRIGDSLFAALAADPLAAHLGIRLEAVGPGYARATMVVRAQLLNAAGTAHGGATMALLDVVHAAASNSHGTLAVAQEVHTEFVAAARAGDRLVAEGREVSRSSRTAVYRIDVVTDAGRLVATGLARVFRHDQPWQLDQPLGQPLEQPLDQPLERPLDQPLDQPLEQR